MEFKLYENNIRNSKESIKIEGKNLDNAIEKNFEKISKWMCIGNGAGYKLISLVISYDATAFNNNGGGVMTIVAQGSEAKVNYDEEKDIPKTYRCWIGGDVKEELKDDIVGEICKNDREFYPMDDTFTRSFPEDKKAGIVLALLDEVSEFCTIKSLQNNLNVSMYINSSRPNYQNINLKRYLNSALKIVEELRPKRSGKVYMDRVSELMDQISDSVKITPGFNVTYHLTLTQFRKKRQIKLLKNMRKKFNLTQKEFAIGSGISLDLYKKLENGEESLTMLCNDKYFALMRLFKKRKHELYDL